MIRALVCAALCLGASTAAHAEPTPAPAAPEKAPAAPEKAPAAPEKAPAPSFELTAPQAAAMGDVVPSGGFAHFSGHGTKTCGMPVLYASGASPWKLTIVTTRAIEYNPSAGGTQAGPKVPQVQEAFRRAVAKCGFPVPEAGKATPIKGSLVQPRKMDPEVMKPLPGPAAMAYLAGAGKNFHNLPAVFAMRHDDQPTLVVAGKGEAPKTFALPGEWPAAMKAYGALLQARGYR